MVDQGPNHPEQTTSTSAKRSQQESQENNNNNILDEVDVDLLNLAIPFSDQQSDPSFHNLSFSDSSANIIGTIDPVSDTNFEDAAFTKTVESQGNVDNNMNNLQNSLEDNTPNMFVLTDQQQLQNIGAADTATTLNLLAATRSPGGGVPVMHAGDSQGNMDNNNDEANSNDLAPLVDNTPNMFDQPENHTGDAVVTGAPSATAVATRPPDTEGQRDSLLGAGNESQQGKPSHDVHHLVQKLYDSVKEGERTGIASFRENGGFDINNQQQDRFIVLLKKYSLTKEDTKDPISSLQRRLSLLSGFKKVVGKGVLKWTNKDFTANRESLHNIKPKTELSGLAKMEKASPQTQMEQKKRKASEDEPKVVAKYPRIDCTDIGGILEDIELRLHELQGDAIKNNELQDVKACFPKLLEEIGNIRSLDLVQNGLSTIAGNVDHLSKDQLISIVSEIEKLMDKVFELSRALAGVQIVAFKNGNFGFSEKLSYALAVIARLLKQLQDLKKRLEQARSNSDSSEDGSNPDHEGGGDGHGDTSGSNSGPGPGQDKSYGGDTGSGNEDDGASGSWGPREKERSTSMFNEAKDMVANGRFNEAKDLFEKFVEGCEKSLARNHPSTLIGKHDLGMLFLRLAKNSETGAPQEHIDEYRNKAEALLRESAEGYEKTLGPYHNNTIVTMNNLASVYIAKEEHMGDAEVLLEECLELRVATLGCEHRDTLSSMMNLAVLYSKRGKNKWAKRYFKECRETQRRVEAVSDDLKDDEELELVLETVKKNGLALRYVSDELKNNKKVVLEAVKQKGWALEHASDELKNCKEVVLEAMKQDGEALEFATDELRKDKEVVLEAVKECGKALKFASDKLKKDKEVVMVAMKQYGMALEFASYSMKNNKEVVLEAVKQNGKALKFASDELRKDKEVVMAAVNQAESSEIDCADADIDGDMIDTILFDQEENESPMTTYARRVVEGMEKIIGKLRENPENGTARFDGRLLIVVPTREFLDALKREDVFDAKMKEWNLTGIGAVESSCRIGTSSDKCKNEPDVIVMEERSKVSGLDYLFVMVVDFDTPIEAGTSLDEIKMSQCIIYKALTRAHLRVTIVNKHIRHGWFNAFHFLKQEEDAVPSGNISLEDLAFAPVLDGDGELNDLCLRDWEKVGYYLWFSGDAVDVKRRRLMWKDYDGYNCLHRACRYGAPVEVTLVMIGIGGRSLVVATDAGGDTPLHYACEYGASLEVIKAFLDVGGMELALMKNNNGYTALHLLCVYTSDHDDCVGAARALLVKGGRQLLHIKDRDGDTAIDWAKEYNAPSDFIEYLTNY